MSDIEEVYNALVRIDGDRIRVDKEARLTIMHDDTVNGYTMMRRYILEILAPGQYCEICSKPMLPNFTCPIYNGGESWHIMRVFGGLSQASVCDQALKYIRGK